MSKEMNMVSIDPVADAIQHSGKDGELPETATNTESLFLATLLKSLRTQESEKAVRLSLETDPQRADTAHSGQFRSRTNLLPPHIIKRICGPAGDELVNQILQVRSNHVSACGRPRSSRFAIGYEFEETVPTLEKEELEQNRKEKKELEVAFWNCGYDDVEEDVKYNLSQFFKMITRDGLAYGMIAVELVRAPKEGGIDRVVAFRAVDAGTIHRLNPTSKNDESKRTEAIRAIARVRGEAIEQVGENYHRGGYKWCQVIEGKITQVFTEDELIVYMLYPTTDVGYNGYPLTPIDQAINAISTHINVTLHNKLYFQHGRAAKGMIVVKSDSMDEPAMQKIRAQFHQSINSVNNSWRTPMFSCGTEDEIQWQGIDSGGRDAEFQYLSDSVARVVMGAFQISPEEVPGYAHLSRGTNTQALSESDNEWKLVASRDVGLRPLLGDIQDLINSRIFPALFPEKARKYRLVFAGIDHDSPEKEATRLSQDMSTHMSFNNVLETVEKEALPPELCGCIPMNPQFRQIMDAYLTVGQVMEGFMGVKGAASDPRFNYLRDPFWMQFQQLEMQKAQMRLQMEMQQLQMMQQQVAAAQQAMSSGDQQGDEEEESDGDEEQGDQPPQFQKGEDLQQWCAINYQFLEKATTKRSSAITKALLRRHRKMVEHHMRGWEEKARETLKAAIEEIKEDQKSD